MASSRPADVFRSALDLFEAGLALMRQNLGRAHPTASERDIDDRLRQWLHHRPGAETGDCSGRPYPRAVMSARAWRDLSSSSADATSSSARRSTRFAAVEGV